MDMRSAGLKRNQRRKIRPCAWTAIRHWQISFAERNPQVRRLMVATRAAVLAAALICDRLFGDPDWLWSRLPHPTVLAGRLIAALDRFLNREDRSAGERRFAGALVVAFVLVLAIAVGMMLTGLIRSLPGHPLAGIMAEAVLASIFLAHKSLLDHVGAVAAALRSGGAPAGRDALSRIVGRDVSALDEPGIARAAIESLAENFSDGIVAPAFWYLVAGLPGLIAYKAVNTADSMIGHRTPRHQAFGWAAARLDDLLNWIPARIAAGLIIAAAAVAGNGRRALKAALDDAAKHDSPNAGWLEAAAAGALGLALGGPRRYGAKDVDGAWFNAKGSRKADIASIEQAIGLINRAWLGVLAVSLVLALVFWRWP
jgi:adenosylcobinamide-phosphate synthase